MILYFVLKVRVIITLKKIKFFNNKIFDQTKNKNTTSMIFQIFKLKKWLKLIFKTA